MNQTPTLNNTEQPTVTETPKQIIDRIMAEKKRYEDATKTLRGQWDTIFDAYNGKMTDKAYPWKSNKFIPKMRTAINSAFPFVFSGEPKFECEGIGMEDQFMAQILEKMANFRIETSIEDAYEKIGAWVLQAMTFGTSVAQVCWKTEVADGALIKDEPSLVTPNIKDVFVNPLIPSIQGQISVIVRSVISVEEAKNNPAYKIPEGMEIQAKGVVVDGTTDSESMNRSYLDNTDQLRGKDFVEIIERWTKEKVQTVINGSTQILARDAEHGYGFIPFIELVYQPDTVPNMFYGKGIGTDTVDLQAFHFDLTNQEVDNIKLVNNQMFEVRRGANVNKKQLVSRPGGFIEVDEIGKDINALPIPDIKQSIDNMISRVDDEINRASASTDLVQGAASNDTLGQDQLAQSNTSQRFDLARKRLKKALGKVGRMIVQLDINNLQDMNAEILRIFPEETREQIFLLIKQEGPSVKYDIRVKGETVLAQNKDIVAKQLVDLLEAMRPVLTPAEIRKLGRKIAQLRGIQEVDELIPEMGDEMMTNQLMPPQMPQVSQEEPTAQGINQAVQQI